MNSKRDRISILHDILEVIRDRGEKVKPTHVMYKANLSHQMLTDYMKELLEKELIRERPEKSGKKTYSLTDKGYNFLKDYTIIKRFMDSYGLD